MINLAGDNLANATALEREWNAKLNDQTNS